MRHSIIGFLLFVLASCVLCCATDDYVFEKDTSGAVDANFSISEADALEMARAFIGNFDARTRAAGDNRIVDQVVPIVRKDVGVTRSDDNRSLLPDTLFYAVNLNDNNGYVIVAADRRVGGVVAFVENGTFNFERLANSEELSLFFSGMIDYYEDAVKGMLFGADSMHPLNPPVYQTDFSIDTIVGPLLTTIWGQKAPFNGKCPLTSKGKRSLAGCVPVASSQIIAYHEYPDSFAGHIYDWSYILLGPIPTTDTGEEDVANLIYDIGVLQGIDYSDTLSGSRNPKVCQSFDSLGYTCTSLSDFDVYVCMHEVEKSRPVYVQGEGYRLKNDSDSLPIGHAWVVDGYLHDKCSLYSAVRGDIGFYIRNLLHCNWGLDGAYNGFYLGSAFDTRKRVYDSNVTRALFFDKNIRMCYNIRPKE